MINDKLSETKITHKGYIVTSDERITPTRYNQLYDELILKEKQFAAMIYYQRDLEGRYP